jgi:DNA-binding GntR family transcriptional regulator
VYESVLLKIQLYMAINLRRESEQGRPEGGVQRHERLIEAFRTGDPDLVLAALNGHGARAYLS